MIKALLERPITEPPKRPGEYWLKTGNTEMIKLYFNPLPNPIWNSFIEEDSTWYEEITLPDDTIIVQ